MSKRATRQPDKTRDDWISAALAALAEGGIDAVKVERLAARLGVSKGSFYWHFKDRPTLLAALLDLWDGNFTQQQIDEAAGLATPAARLRKVAELALRSRAAGVANPAASSISCCVKFPSQRSSSAARSAGRSLKCQ